LGTAIINNPSDLAGEAGNISAVLQANDLAAPKNCPQVSQVNPVCVCGQLPPATGRLNTIDQARRTDRKQFPLED